MRREYQRVWSDTVTSGHDKKVYDDYVKPGYILYVGCCYVWTPDRAPWSKTFILVEMGGQEMVVRCRAEDSHQCGVSAVRPFYVGEHQRIVGWAPSAAVGDKLNLNISGVLTRLRKWRKG